MNTINQKSAFTNPKFNVMNKNACHLITGGASAGSIDDKLKKKIGDQIPF